MISSRTAKIAASGLVMGLSLTGAHQPEDAKAEKAGEAKAMQAAANAAAKATKAMASRNERAAVSAAENAVEYQPHDPQYRMLLGQVYMSAGRFASAETAFSDVLSMSPNNSRAALNLALVQTAQGKRDRAQSTLADYADRLSASDFGLAAALAGDVDTGIRALEASIRDNGGDARTRQNLGLAYAMAGKWMNARAMAGQDLAPEAVNDRIAEWAAFVQPASSGAQVASLLGTTPASQDAGQPVRLALNTAPAATALASAAPAPVVEKVAAPVQTTPVAFEVAAAVPVEPAAAPVFEVAPRAPKAAPVIRADIAPLKRAVAYIPAPRPTIVPTAARVALTKPQRKAWAPVENGKFVVQIGAFENAAVSRDAWKRLAPRYNLGGFNPANSQVKVGSATFVRLAVGGFETRGQANSICARIRYAGGSCFVRGTVNDALAQWAQRSVPKVIAMRPIEMASR